MSPRSAHRPGTDMVAIALKACLTAKDAAFNLRDYFFTSSRIALLTIQQCERELDTMERVIDQKIPEAMVRVGEQTARELLASVRFLTDLERIGDLLLWVAERPTLKELAEDDRSEIASMVSILERMLEQVHDGLRDRSIDLTISVLQQDRELDRIRRSVFDRHLRSRRRSSRSQSIDVLFIVQSIERAGDHATNLAEEIVHLIEHRSIRHTNRALSTSSLGCDTILRALLIQVLVPATGRSRFLFSAQPDKQRRLR